ncbi:hypothetical protein OF83DRAFT_916224 [Amylostereum chailletii]|nr:hypothetical protein OF83DRAFT_916224 [Amylostereum chailletii]
MARQLEPTLRKLALVSPYRTMFALAEFKAFTSSLVRLEHIACIFSYSEQYNPHSLRSHIALPPSLPHLTHLAIGWHTSFTFPNNITPTHVHIPLDYLLPDLLSLSLTHLSLSLSDSSPNAPALHTHAPNLISLALSGTLSEITSFLTRGPLPPVPHLILTYVCPAMENLSVPIQVAPGEWEEGAVVSVVEWKALDVQACLDAIATGPDELRVVRLLDEDFVERYGIWRRAPRCPCTTSRGGGSRSRMARVGCCNWWTLFGSTVLFVTTCEHELSSGSRSLHSSQRLNDLNRPSGLTSSNNRPVSYSYRIECEHGISLYRTRFVPQHWHSVLSPAPLKKRCRLSTPRPFDLPQCDAQKKEFQKYKVPQGHARTQRATHTGLCECLCFIMPPTSSSCCSRLKNTRYLYLARGIFLFFCAKKVHRLVNIAGRVEHQQGSSSVTRTQNYL